MLVFYLEVKKMSIKNFDFKQVNSDTFNIFKDDFMLYEIKITLDAPTDKFCIFALKQLKKMAETNEALFNTLDHYDWYSGCKFLSDEAISYLDSWYYDLVTTCDYCNEQVFTEDTTEIPDTNTNTYFIEPMCICDTCSDNGVLAGKIKLRKNNFGIVIDDANVSHNFKTTDLKFNVKNGDKVMFTTKLVVKSKDEKDSVHFTKYRLATNIKKIEE